MIKNVFFWCHIRHINPGKIHPERITQNDKNLIDTLDYERIEFVSMFSVIKTLWLIQFVYYQKLKIQWICYWSQIIMFTWKILIDLCLAKQKTKIKNIFTKVIYSVLVVK